MKKSKKFVLLTGTLVIGALMLPVTFTGSGLPGNNLLGLEVSQACAEGPGCHPCEAGLVCDCNEGGGAVNW